MDANESHADTIKNQIYASGLGHFNLENELAREEKLQEESIKNEMSVFKEGYNFVLDHINKNAVDGFFVASEDAEKVALEDCKISDDVLEEMKKVENWRGWLLQEGKLKGVVRFSNQVIYNFYEVATFYYDNGSVESAHKCFAFLCQLNPRVSVFWLGRGLTSEKLQNYGRAISEFETAIKMNNTDFIPYLGIIRCSQEAGDYSVIERVLNENKDIEELKDKIRDAFEYLSVVKQK